MIRYLTADLDKMVRAISAFPSFSDLLNACRRHNYVPTLRPDSFPRMNEERSRGSVMVIREELDLRGCKVYPEFGAFEGEGEK